MRVIASIIGYKPGSQLPIVHRIVVRLKEGKLLCIRDVRIRVFRKEIESRGLKPGDYFTCIGQMDPNGRGFFQADPKTYRRTSLQDVQQLVERGQVPNSFLYVEGESGNPAVQVSVDGKTEAPEETCVYKKKYGTPPKEFKIGAELWAFLCRCVEKGESLLLCGPTGCGKTTLAMLLAKAVGKESEYFAFGGMSDPRTTLIGRTRIGTEGDYFQISRFAAILTEVGNRVMVWDEVNRSPSEAQDILLPVLQEGIIDIPEGDTVVVKERLKGISVVATANIGREYGVEMMGPQFLDRFTRVDLGYISVLEEEVAFVMERVKGAKKAEVTTLVKIAHDTRAMMDRDELPCGVSTRRILSASQLLADGFSLLEAISYYFFPVFSVEGGPASERARVMQVCEKYGVVNRAS